MSAPASNKSSAGLPVLLVDDEAALLQTLRLSLQNEFDIELASSAAEAELMMATKTYKVVVCDHLMPGEEGLHFLIRASERFSQTRRILITGYMNPELLARSVAIAGLSSVILKPAKGEDVAKAIRAALEKKAEKV
jgi:two-component system response regulator HupR/HoxA